MFVNLSKVAFFVFVLLMIRCFIKKPSQDIVSCVLGKKKKVKEEVKDKGTLQCVFPTNDVLGGMVFTNDGDIVTSQPNITCDECTKYVYKDREGKCYKFVHDAEYNADTYCLTQEGGTCKDVCTSQLVGIPCPFKNRHQS